MSGARGLTTRQIEIVAMVVRGDTVKEVARKLSISIHTARSHVQAIARNMRNPHGLPALKLIRASRPHQVVMRK